MASAAHPTRPPRRLKRSTLLLFLAALVGLALVVHAGIRLQHRMAGQRPPPGGAADVGQIEGWMTIPYIARLYHVPPQDLFRALEVTPGRSITMRTTLDQIAASQGRNPTDVTEAARTAVRSYRAAHPRPPRPMPFRPPGTAPPPPTPGGGA